MHRNSNLLGPKSIRLGLCCINNFLKQRKPPIFSSRSIVLATYNSKGKIEAIKKAQQNLLDIQKMLNWNKAHYIECFRLSSSLFPHYSNIKSIPEKERYSIDYFKKELKAAGDLAKKYGHRITMHPSQYNVVATPQENIFENTMVDLQMHSDILDMMELDANSIMVVHGGGVYGDKEKTIERWIENFKRLSVSIQNRLVLENCEKNFSIIDCLKINRAIEIPIVFDNHHFECYKQLHPEESFQPISFYIKAALETWTKKGLRPKFHLSEQGIGKQIGSHSDYINDFPQYYLEIPEKYGCGVDIMIEAKAKEAAIFDLYQKYPNYFLSHQKDIKKENLEELFAYSTKTTSAKFCYKCNEALYENNFS